MFVSSVSHHQQHSAQSMQSAQAAGHAAAAEQAARAEPSGNLDLLAAEKLYREKASELKALSARTGAYEVATLTDSEIKSLRSAGVPIDAFLQQHGQKLGVREFTLLADLIQKTHAQQGVAAADGAAFTQSAAMSAAVSRAYV